MVSYVSHADPCVSESSTAHLGSIERLERLPLCTKASGPDEDCHAQKLQHSSEFGSVGSLGVSELSPNPVIARVRTSQSSAIDDSRCKSPWKHRVHSNQGPNDIPGSGSHILCSADDGPVAAAAVSANDAAVPDQAHKVAALNIQAIQLSTMDCGQEATDREGASFVQSPAHHETEHVPFDTNTTRYLVSANTGCYAEGPEPVSDKPLGQRVSLAHSEESMTHPTDPNIGIRRRDATVVAPDLCFAAGLPCMATLQDTSQINPGCRDFLSESESPIPGSTPTFLRGKSEASNPAEHSDVRTCSNKPLHSSGVDCTSNNINGESDSHVPLQCATNQTAGNELKDGFVEIQELNTPPSQPTSAERRCISVSPGGTFANGEQTQRSTPTQLPGAMVQPLHPEASPLGQVGLNVRAHRRAKARASVSYVRCSFVSDLQTEFNAIQLPGNQKTSLRNSCNGYGRATFGGAAEHTVPFDNQSSGLAMEVAQQASGLKTLQPEGSAVEEVLRICGQVWTCRQNRNRRVFLEEIALVHMHRLHVLSSHRQ